MQTLFHDLGITSTALATSASASPTRASSVTSHPAQIDASMCCQVVFGVFPVLVWLRGGRWGCRAVCGAVPHRSRAPSASLTRCRCAAPWTWEPLRPLAGSVAGRLGPALPHARHPRRPPLGWAEAGTVVISAGRRYSRRGLSGLGGGGHHGGQGAVELAGDVTLEAAPDLACGLALRGASCDVGAGLGAAAHPCEGDGVDRAVQCPGSPPRLRRWRTVWPLLACSGLVPASAAKAASFRHRPG
jgi:hypothetical protein